MEARGIAGMSSDGDTLVRGLDAARACDRRVSE
jgi:hypothetical protein